MNKLDSQSMARSFSIPTAALDAGPVRRLIVLAPDPETDIANAAQSVWNLANALGCGIQLLGLCGDETQEPSLRRQMVTLSAMLTPIAVESRIEFGRDWLEVIRHNWQAGDVIACFAGQPSGLGNRPLSQLLAAGVDVPVHVLGGLYPEVAPRPNWLSSILVWTGSLGILAIFFWLQVKLTDLPGDWAHTALLYLSILVEVSLLWGWNTLFG